MKSLTFKKKLIGFVLLISIIPIIMITLFSYFSAKKELESSIYKGNTVFLELIQENINSYFNEKIDESKVIKSSSILKEVLFDVTNSSKIESANNYLNEIATSYGFQSSFITNKSGAVISTSDQVFKGLDVSKDVNIQNAIKGETNWTDLYYFEPLNTNILVLSTPILADEQIIGTFNIVIDQKNINAIVHKGVKTLGESGDSYIVNKDLLLLTDTQLGDFKENAALKESVDSEGTQLLSKAIINNDLDFKATETYIDYLGNPVLGSLGVVMIGDNPQGLVIELDYSEGFAGLIKFRSIVIVIIVVFLLMIVGVSVLLIKGILAPIHNTNSMLKDIAEGDGDLTKRLHIQTRDEYGRLGNLFNGFVESIRNIIQRFIGNASQLANASKQISSAVDEASKNMDSINTLITDISDMLQSNASAVEESNASIEEISSGSSMIADEAMNVSTHSKEVLQSTKDGIRNLESAINAMGEVDKSSKAMGNELNDLNKASEKIHTIVDIIKGISEQVNLLALNAAIEAARAGEHGKGFAVVADEVRKLAEESKKSAIEISDLVGAIRVKSEAAKKASTVEQNHVEKSVEKMNATQTEFEQILNKIEQVTEMVENIDKMTKNQSLITEDMAKAMNEIAQSSIENADTVNGITSNIQNQVAVFEEINSSVEELAELADQLHKETRRFKV